MMCPPISLLSLFLYINQHRRTDHVYGLRLIQTSRELPLLCQKLLLLTAPSSLFCWLLLCTHTFIHTPYTHPNTLFLTCFKSSAHIRWQSGAFIKPDRETQPEINFHAMMAADCRCMGVHFASQQAAAHTEPMMAARTPPQRLKDFQWRQ